ncbi:hypothetical protein SOVF_060870 isoform B [Spinacia oleracea]|uniref:Transcription factor bHLH57 isoform X2 n=1 Tax=Spinacia oleracea TaxID=3562 RepID=A0A9R0IB32_SPIOL|nr:transcription factor bHLH57-like isoform X2 [Spinacia oleracea]KNA19530.1 hypothetical protein SOVF_060870 isoform B [Spinacia oleracea]
MEKLQGPINPCQLITEDFEVGNWLEEFISSTTTGSLKFEDPYNYYSEETSTYNGGECNLPSLEDKMPFLQMLQTVEQHHQHQQQQQQQQHQHSVIMQQFEPANFQFLLRLQHQLVVESCVTTNQDINVGNNNHNDGVITDLLHSPGVKSETTEVHPNERVKEEDEKCDIGRSNKRTHVLKTTGVTKEKRKRKRSTRPAKNKEEVETQRMTHIAVERNRRRQMNQHLNALRSLMPPSYVQRGDQASIIGGAIDFVKELEQMLQSLQAQKRMKQIEENGDVSISSTTSTSSSSNVNLSNIFMASSSSSSFHQLRSPLHSQEEGKGNGKGNEEYSAEKKSALADIEVVVIQNHVNLKIQCQRKPGQLIQAIVAFEELRLTVLHLNITSLHSLVHYSFNLKIEEDCKLGSADEVARAVHQIFSLINLT